MLSAVIVSVQMESDMVARPLLSLAKLKVTLESRLLFLIFNLENSESFPSTALAPLRRNTKICLINCSENRLNSKNGMAERVRLGKT